MIHVTYVTADGKPHEVEVKAGSNLMQCALDNNVPGIVGECGGMLACATCHVFVDEAWQEKTGTPESFEQDMLQGAIDPNEASRLACQIKLSPELDGLVVHLPEMQI